MKRLLLFVLVLAALGAAQAQQAWEYAELSVLTNTSGSAITVYFPDDEGTFTGSGPISDVYGKAVSWILEVPESRQSLVAVLNAFGQKGWQLTAVVFEPRDSPDPTKFKTSNYFFKRPIQIQ